MAWRECTNCGMKQAPYEPRKRKGDHLLCKQCARLPIDSLKATGAKVEEGTPGADLSSDFEPAVDLRPIYQTPVSTNEHGHPVNHVGLPTRAPHGDEMWPEQNDLGTENLSGLVGALPNQVWLNHRKQRLAKGLPPVPYRGVNKGFGKRLAAKTAHADPHGNQDMYGTHSHHPYIPPFHHSAHNLGPLVTHLMEKHLDSDGVSAEAMSDAAGNSSKMDALHTQAHSHGDVEHGHPAGKSGHFHQHLHSGSAVMDDPSLADWEKALLGHVTDHDADEPQEADDSTPTYEHAKKIKDHLKSKHNIPDDQISGSDLFNHSFHEDLHEAGDQDHKHHPPPALKDYVSSLPESTAAYKAHLVASHGLQPYDVSYDSLSALKATHDSHHEDNGHHNPDHQHEDSSAPPKYPHAQHADSAQHLLSEHGISVPDHGADLNHEKHVYAHKINGVNQSHYHEADDPTEVTPAPPTAPGGSLYQALVDHLKEGNNHNGYYYSGWENGESYENLLNHHTNNHSSHNNQDHEHEDLNDPTSAGSAAELKAAEGDEDAAPKSKKPGLPQWGDPDAPSDPEMYAWPQPQVDHPKNKSEVIQHLQDHHPEVNAEDYENSEFKNEGFLKGWHSHLHSGKEGHLSPADLHVHGNDDSKPKFQQDDNIFSHMVTHHGMSEDEAKSHRYVDLVSSHAHTHTSGDDEEIGHQHDYPGAPPSEPATWVVNPHHAGSNHEHEWYHGTSNDYSGAPVNATQNMLDRGNWGSHGGSIYDCHVSPHFTALHQMAKNFGSGRIISVKIKGKKPKYYDNLNHMAHDAYDRLHALGEIEDGGTHLGKHYQDPKYTGQTINSDSNSYGGCCSKALLKYAQGEHRSDGKYGLRRFRDSLRADGYDHIIVRNHADSPQGHENLLALSPHQIHVVNEKCPRSHGDARDHDVDNFSPPSGWSSNTMPNEKEKLRPPGYLVDKDPKIGNPYDLPKEAPEHPDDQGDPEKGRRNENPGNTYSSGSGDDDDDDDDNEQYCDHCGEYTSHSSYDSHCDECNQYTGDGDCDCSYCPACGHDTPHGDDPGNYHEYCEHCDEQGTEGGYGDHSSDDHEDEYGEHPDKFKPHDWCPHCDTHDKANRDEENCQNCGGSLPDWDKITEKKEPGQYPVPGGGTTQWDHKTHAWGHLVHDHGLDLSDTATDPETLATAHKNAHTNAYKTYDPEAGHHVEHQPGHQHDEFPQSTPWDNMTKEQKQAHLVEGHGGGFGLVGGMAESDLDSKHKQGHSMHYMVGHGHTEGVEPTPVQEHAPDNIITHMKTLHSLNTGVNLTEEQAHALHNEAHAMGKPFSEWNHEHTPEGVSYTGKHGTAPSYAAEHVATIEHLHEAHSHGGVSVPGVHYPPDSVQGTHLGHHNLGGGLAPHDHPVQGINGGTPDNINPHTDPYGHLKDAHGWSDEQVAKHKVDNAWQGSEEKSGMDAHSFEHSHGSHTGTEDYQPHTHAAATDVPSVPKAYTPASGTFSNYEQHKQHMIDVHGLTPPEGQSSKFYSDLHYHLHGDPHDAAHELGLDHNHAQHEHTSTGAPLDPKQPFYGKDDGYGLKDHLVGAHPEFAKANGVGGMAPYGTSVKDLADAHAKAHAEGQEHGHDWMHTHAPDPDAPLLPEKGHLSDELVKHLVQKHGKDIESLGGAEHNDELKAQHAEAHGGHSEDGALPADYDDPHYHKHTVKQLQTLHGNSVEDGKPTVQSIKDVEQGNSTVLASHMNAYHPATDGHYYDASTHPDKLLGDHAAAHAGSEAHQNPTPHDHDHPGNDTLVGTEPHGEAIEHLVNHHGVSSQGLADKSPGYTQMLHTHEHYTKGVNEHLVNHDHNEQGTTGVNYPPAPFMAAQHDPHSLAHHLEDHHGMVGAHGYGHDTLLDAHNAAHDEMKDLQGTPAPQHQHTSIYPAGHEQGPQMPSTSALHEHIKNGHGGGNSINNMSHQEAADHHEMLHMSSGNGHAHSTQEMGDLSASENKVTLPPKSIPPIQSSYEIDGHLAAHHGIDYGKQSNTGLTGQAALDFHEAEHASGVHTHAHQKKGADYGIPPYPANPTPHVPKEDVADHMAQAHGVNVDPAQAEMLHSTIHKQHVTDHDHQPHSDSMPSAGTMQNTNAPSFSDHLVEAHGFHPDTVKGMDFPALQKAHESGHQDDALPFHKHTEANGPKTPIKQMTPEVGQSVLANHLTYQHGIEPKDHNGDWHPVETMQAMHDQHHGHHGDEGFGHTHPTPVDVPHFDPKFGDTEAAKQHMIEHHGATEASLAGASAAYLKSDHDYYHQSSAYEAHQLSHTHQPPAPKGHAEMSKEELVDHLNQHHDGMSLAGGDHHSFYEEVHQAGHGGPAAPSLLDGGAAFTPKAPHDHPDISIAHPKAPETTAPDLSQHVHDLNLDGDTVPHHSDMDVQAISDHMNEHHGANFKGNSSKTFYEDQHEHAHGPHGGNSAYAPMTVHTHAPAGASAATPAPQAPSSEMHKHVMSHEPAPGFPVHPPVQTKTLLGHMADHHHYGGASGMSSEELHDQHDELHANPVDDFDKHGHILSPHPATSSNYQGVHDGNVDEHLKNAHGATIGGGWEEQMGAHNAFHAVNGPHLDHTHPEKVAPPAPASVGPSEHPHFHPAVNPQHLIDHHGMTHEQVDVGSHYELHEVHANDHAEPQGTGNNQHTHAPAPVVPHPADLTNHMLMDHKVSHGHEQVGDPAFHAELHAEPNDHHDASHTHGDALTHAPTEEAAAAHAHELAPATPAPEINKNMLHPNALNIDKHLEKHLGTTVGIPDDHQGKHDLHAALHHVNTFESIDPHKHNKWTGQGNGIDHTASLVRFFEEEWV